MGIDAPVTTLEPTLDPETIDLTAGPDLRHEPLPADALRLDPVVAERRSDVVESVGLVIGALVLLVVMRLLTTILASMS